MNFKKYFLSLNKEERKAYAKRAKSTVGYIQIHLVSRRKTPGKPLMLRLSAASNGRVSDIELLKFFYIDAVPKKQKTNKQQENAHA